ncbi:MAG: hypothetical protein LBQ78_08330 [Tannerellaceae bacterium]|jgi:hypothetical protein|nr:hypothetical protein [Tannerellaceae bacterium]
MDMEKDFINGTFLTLVEQKRVKEVVDFCERVAAEAPFPELKCIALRNLSEAHFFLTGDVAAARKANEEGLAILDGNMELVNHSPKVPPQIMKRIYSDLCEQIRAMAASMEEYEQYAHKPKAVRSLNATEKRGLAAIKEMRENGIQWKEDLFGRIDGYYPVNGEKVEDGLGQAASLLLLAIENRRSLRLDRTDLNYAIQQYANAICELVDSHLAFCEAKHQKADAANYLFILKKAISVVSSCEDDRNADKATIDRHLEQLNTVASDIERRCHASHAPSPEPTKEDIDKYFPYRMNELRYGRVNIQDTDRPQKSMTGCLVIQLIVSLAITSWLWYVVIGKGNTAWYTIVPAIFFTLSTLGFLVGAIGGRKQNG